MDDLLGDFVAETLENLETLSGEVIAWETDPSDRDRLDAFFRFFHTVKGSCGFLNLPRVEKLAHRAEDVLAAIRTGDRTPDPHTISAVLAVMDRIGDIARAYGDNLPVPAEDGDEALLDALTAAPVAPAPVEELVGEVELDDGSARTLPSTPRERAPRTIRISLSLIDQLMNAVSDMVLARNELSRKLRDTNADPDVEGSFERLSACVADMRDMVSKTRMQRVDRLFTALPRMVRDLSQDLGKKVELVLEGGDVEMDREMIEMVLDPLTHIVRNALDHGLETPIERMAAGKTETGHVRIAARQSGNQIVIEVVDNGRGIATENLVAKALRLKLIGENEAAGMTHAEKLALIFHAGLSTAEQVSAISGRGVGMDVVRTNVERIGGVVTLDSTVGRGTIIQLRVPMTLTIIPGLILRCGTELFAIPRGNVIELLHENSAMVTVENVAGARVATIRGLRYSVVDLEHLLGREREHVEGGARTLMLVGSPTGVPYALGVDAVENHEELVIRPASPVVMAAGIFAGMTLPDNGRPMLLLDPAGIAQVADLPMELDKSEAVQAELQQRLEEKQAQTIPALQFVEKGGQHRLIPLDTVERIEDLPAALFGVTEGQQFVRLQDRLVRVANPGTINDELVKTLHLKVGGQEICYVVEDVADIIDMPIRPHLRVRTHGIAGVVSHEGQHLEVIDAHALFAGQAADNDSGATAPGTCLIAGLADDPWMRTILAPLLVQAGYDVRDAGTPEIEASHGPAVLLCDNGAGQDDGVGEGHGPAMPIIRLRAQADADMRDPHQSIYRYDRASLLAAVDGALRRQAA
ncbi:chemotaxis protein CheW [Sphingobium sufflavum]|uniref:chemotaxis protein CheA n=1 Tax=Sphingobium sufflavum TaxID=1129547 RepID=UPI001F2DBDBB|nr:chemotaxis protein CheW [Sphingobium sufflavum]MCE7798495.1 chemotaxis protein CheW [Sphingobium sufflavum]